MTDVRIIVADTQELISDGVSYRLRKAPGMTVVGHVVSGEALLEWLKKNSADLVLMDVSLHTMDGIDTTRALRGLHPKLKVLAYSVLHEIEYVNSMLIEGASGYLVKGGEKEELIEAIELVMDGGRYISPAARESVAQGYHHCDKRMDGEYLGLTHREREIIRLIALERTTDEIAAELFISPDTVKTHRKNLMTKLDVRSTAGLVKYAIDRCWV